MELLNKTNPRATWRSVLRYSIYGAVSVPAFFFVFGKPAIRAHWPVLLPVFAILGAAIAALHEWQVGDPALLDSCESDAAGSGEGGVP